MRNGLLSANDKLYLDASKLNYGSLSMKNIGLAPGEQGNVNLLSFTNYFSRSSRATSYALGNTQIKVVDSEGTIKLFSDKYDWNFHNFSIAEFRDGKLPKSKRDRLIYQERIRHKLDDRHGFPVEIYGVGKIKKE